MRTFTDRYPYLGPILWVLSFQYFVAQLVAARAWSRPFSLLQNTISDLGNTACGTYGTRYVCSPLHDLMNTSFLSLGLVMIGGSLLIYQEFRASRGAAIGFSFMALAGLGALLVGLFPENTIAALHSTGATLVFLVGNLALVIFGIVLAMPRVLRVYTLLSGIVSLIALGFFGTSHYLGLGIGGMERITAYPQTLWLIVFGMYVSRNHYMARRRKA